MFGCVLPRNYTSRSCERLESGDYFEFRPRVVIIVPILDKCIELGISGIRQFYDHAHIEIARRFAASSRHSLALESEGSAAVGMRRGCEGDRFGRASSWVLGA